jgi:hypothetical protein
MDRELKMQLEESRYLKRGLKPNLDHDGETRWLKKPVCGINKLSLTEDYNKISLVGPGTLSICMDKTMSGEGSAKITVPTSLEIKNPSNRAYATSELYRQLDNENITRYNRLSVWIYADAPGFHCVFFNISIHNKGEHIMPIPGRFEGTHYPCLSPDSWHHVVWEIPYLYRDCVAAISMGVSLMGSLPEGAEEISVYFDGLQLEEVEEENYLGFDLRKNSIAYCHSGYRCDTVKQALVQHCAENSFYLLNEDGQEVFRAEDRELKAGFKMLDFSEFNIPGRYTLHIGELASQPFSIGDDAYIAAAWKTLNFFYMERCGADVPGVHSICHQDVLCMHPDGRKMNISGGWHDAADLSQGLMNTIESAFAMLELAQAVQHKEKDLYERLMEEARWGLNWVMRTRFGDGYRNDGYLVGIWTNNIIGDKDDIVVSAQNNALINFMAATLCAKAARLFTDDQVFSEWCLKCAAEDFDFARARIGVSSKSKTSEVILYAQATAAGYELFTTSCDKKYLEFAVQYAHVVMDCQQKVRRNDFSIPLSGFFYENRKKERILAFFHKSYEHAPMQALSCLYRSVPEHPDALLWKESIALYGAYLKDTANLVEPYSVLPNAIYELDNSDFSGIYHEGDRSVGMPTMQEYNEQVKNGIKLSDTHYLRRFPVAFQFRGFHATILSKAKAAAYIYRAFGDSSFLSIAIRQMEWILGYNPFALSSVYGEGYDYPPLYVAFSNQLVGAVPVGFETFENLDEPFFPMQIAPTYKEVWVHTTCRLMWLISDLYERPI